MYSNDRRETMVNFFSALFPCIIQPRIVLDPAQNFQVMCGGNIYCGKNENEFDGAEIPELEIKEVPADMVYVWLSYFF